jgi:hypothetical protein
MSRKAVKENAVEEMRFLQLALLTSAVVHAQDRASQTIVTAFLADLRSGNQSREGLVFDVGSNNGLWSASVHDRWICARRRDTRCSSCKRCSSNSTLHFTLVEPQPGFTSHLREIAARINGTVYPAVASWTTGNATLFTSRNSQAASETRAMAARYAALPPLTVPRIDFVSLLKRATANGAGARAAGVVTTPRASARRLAAGPIRDYFVTKPTAKRPLKEHSHHSKATSKDHAKDHHHAVSKSPKEGASPSVLSLLKVDIESGEYLLLPQLLTSGALCRVDYLYVEWHLNALSPPDRLAGVGLHLTLEELLQKGCKRPPRLVEHEMYAGNNQEVDVPGLAEEAALHAEQNDTWQRAKHAAKWREAHAVPRSADAETPGTASVEERVHTGNHKNGTNTTVRGGALPRARASLPASIDYTGVQLLLAVALFSSGLGWRSIVNRVLAAGPDRKDCGDDPEARVAAAWVEVKAAETARAEAGALAAYEAEAAAEAAAEEAVLDAALGAAAEAEAAGGGVGQKTGFMPGSRRQMIWDSAHRPSDR